MKTYLKVVIGAVIIGGIMAFFFYQDIQKEVIAITKTEDIVYVFQAGVFKSLENAQNKQQEYAASGILKDNDLYRVIIAVTRDNKEKLEHYFQEQGIDFYIKEISRERVFLEKLQNFDHVIEKSTKESVIN
ncbi:MAG: hypothetical protein K2M17_02265, partial [Bacilli bacterium]|nr:hypothetical protein [Bacilli bacterium]